MRIVLIIKELGHRVIAATTPWIAAKDAFYTEPRTFEDSVFLYRFDHVLATCRRVATGRRCERRDTVSVKVYGQQKYVTNELLHLIY